MIPGGTTTDPMSKTEQPTLFPLPALDDSRTRKGKERLHAFMKINGIVTQSMKKSTKDEASIKWVAVKVPTKRLDNGKPIGSMNIGEMFAWFGRLLDEGGYAGYGPTEAQAVEAVCEERKIPFAP